jgi:hypothetical protein
MAGRPKKVQEKIQEEEKFVPEVVTENVTREEKKENPMDMIEKADAERVRAPGKWRKVSFEELADLESKGLLKGYDPETSEALIKES